MRPNRFDRGGRHLLHRLGVGDVGGDRERLAAGLLDLARHTLGLLACFRAH